MTESERRFLVRLAAAAPEAGGYREPSARAGTDHMLRGHIASQLESLRAKLAQLRSSAEEEGEEDMMDDLDRLDSRMERTIEALRAEGWVAPFQGAADVLEEDLAKLCAYDLQLLEDLDLLRTDVMGMKYETIGNLTLREAEGTLAAIELKVANRKDVMDISGRA
ncbi:MAG TPA: hypothetical protein VJV23_07040 [Candidatus Polarisedimenticolia bacterium]|nr:hypothetical protein [Candidatus Polarisedimenticolia bacterium]